MTIIINSLPIETIKYYAQQYANPLKYHRQHQKVYQKIDVGGKNSQKNVPPSTTSAKTTSIIRNTTIHPQQKKVESTNEIKTNTNESNK